MILKKQKDVQPAKGSIFTIIYNTISQNSIVKYYAIKFIVKKNGEHLKRSNFIKLPLFEKYFYPRAV